MGRTLWEVFVNLFRDEEERTREEDDARFVPSPLDVSVRVAHGGQDDEQVRALSEIEEQAQDIEENQRDN